MRLKADKHLVTTRSPWISCQFKAFVTELSLNATFALSSLIILENPCEMPGELNNALSSSDMELMTSWTSSESDHLRVTTVIGEGFARQELSQSLNMLLKVSGVW